MGNFSIAFLVFSAGKDAKGVGNGSLFFEGNTTIEEAYKRVKEEAQKLCKKNKRNCGAITMSLYTNEK